MYTVPRKPLRLVDYAFRALGKDEIPLQKLVFFIAFDLRQLPPSRARNLILDLHKNQKLEIKNDVVYQPQEVVHEREPLAQIPKTSTSSLGEQLRLFVSSSRLSRAVGMDDQAIEFRRLSEVPLKIEASVHGTREYRLELDEEIMQISHDCPDWRRVSVLHRFCKHVAKLFLLLEKEEAFRLLQSLQTDSWEFVQL